LFFSNYFLHQGCRISIELLLRRTLVQSIVCGASEAIIFQIFYK